VAIYSIDTSGLGGNALPEQAALRVLAEDTGGMAVVNTNNYATGFSEIVRDNSTYYLVGYYPNPVHRDGEFHRVSVRVKPPGLTVRTRRGYLAAPPGEKPPAASTSIDKLNQALRSPVPRRDVSIEAVATPIGSVKAAGAVLLTAAASVETAVTTDASVDVAYRVIDAEGRTLVERATRYPVAAGRPEDAGRLAVRFTDRIDLPRGRHEIRLAMHMPGGKTGSVVTYGDVPNFKENRLSLSGLRLETATNDGVSVLAGGGSEPSDPAVTTERRFPSSATLRVRASVYGRLDRPDQLAVTARLQNEAGAVVREKLPVSIESGGRMPQERNASIQVPLPGLQPGVYTLVVDAGTTGRRPAATRQIVLAVVAP
jgi:hypothetical protein